MTPLERARSIGWDVTPTEDRNPMGITIAIEVRRWNVATLMELKRRQKAKPVKRQ